MNRNYKIITKGVDIRDLLCPLVAVKKGNNDNNNNNNNDTKTSKIMTRIT